MTVVTISNTSRGSAFWWLVFAVGAFLPKCGFSAISAEDVQRSIERGGDYLVQQQNNNGHWPEIGNFPGGVTALCTLALLSSGDSPDDPHIVSALDYLRKLNPPTTTYVTALQTMVLCAATPRKDRLIIRRNVKALEKWQIRDGTYKGAWTYGAKKQPDTGDNSNAQFALLALNEAERMGIEVQTETWRMALEYWQRVQLLDGSWSYGDSNNVKGTGSMTCAGIASLVIAAGRFTDDAVVSADGNVQCCGTQKDGETTDRIERGLQWLGRNFSVHTNPSTSGRRSAGRTWYLYYLYGVERVGRMTGRRFISGHDWYREGAEVLVAAQDEFKGFWKGAGVAESRPQIATALSLLFLSKGQRPILVAKVQHTQDNDWNHHRSDVANLTRYAEQRWGRDMSWQSVDLQAATTDDLQQAPVLFISGRDGLNLAADKKHILRAYVDRGGFIFAESCCGGEGFDHDFRQLIHEIFPDSPLRKLPYDHPVWYAEAKVDLDHAPDALWGVDACCRTSVVYCTDDISCHWELGHVQRNRNHAEAVEAKIIASYNLGVNILAYATGRQLKNKLDVSRPLISNEDKSPRTRGVLHIPKLMHQNGSDDAPAALSNLLEFLARKLKMRVGTQKRLLPMTDETLLDFHLAFIHGRREFRISDEDRKALARFIEGGGVVIADSICASEEFTMSLRRVLSDILPGGSWQPIPVDHKLFTREYGGFDLSRVTRRDPQARSDDDPLHAKLVRTTPTLEGLLINERYAVLFSPYDLSCALENTPSLECQGYITEDAARIGLNMILYALLQ